MFGRFFKKKTFRQRCGREPAEGQGICCAHPLSDFAQGAHVVVVSNSNRKTLEMGLFSGALVTIIKNRPTDANMVVAAGEGRYIIAKQAAEQIQVR